MPTYTINNPKNNNNDNSSSHTNHILLVLAGDDPSNPFLTHIMIRKTPSVTLPKLFPPFPSNPHGLWGKSNPHVSDSFTLNSSKCCFVIAIWSPRRLSWVFFLKTRKLWCASQPAGFSYQKVQIWFKTRFYIKEILVVRNCPKASLSSIGCGFKSSVTIRRYSMLKIVENNLWEKKNYARITGTNRKF